MPTSSHSPLRVEVNPWTLDSTLLEVMQLRGAYVAAIGTVETILTELAIRASKDPAYTTVRSNFPSRRPDRIKFLKRVTELPGPLSRYRLLILSIVRRFEEGLSMRDVFAHGRMQILSGPGENATIKLQDYSAQGGQVAFREDVYYLDSLRRRVHASTRLSRAVDRLYFKIGDLLPHISGQYQGTTEIA